MSIKKKIINIGELAKELKLVDKRSGKLSTHTLRYWEKQFKEVKPVLLNGNRRYYTKNTVNLFKLIKFLLKDQGMTINGAKKILDKKIKSLDAYESSSIKAEYYKERIKLKSKLLLNKLKKIRK